MEGKPEELSSVCVAVRVRPFNPSEKLENSQGCVSIDYKENLIVMGKDRSFTFDQVFGVDSKQSDVFEACTKDLVFSVFKGYNATVLAYGQTGSGKTFTMGSGQVANIKEEEIGIIPRVISMIFTEVDKRRAQSEFTIKVSFLEIYNEEIHDLLASNSMVPEKSISIREDKGSIILMGLHEEIVANSEEMLTCLERGTLQRIVASTLMNANSSRSHAIFTINIEQTVLETQPEVTEGQEHMIAKFHFVDLAGSERAKRTGASGNTLREGISINKGLLCLGNVISALTEEGSKKNHVPYRDSKLTRILQDSLGGNAKTYMIACISPAEINFEETLNTLKYASRARNIKNKPVVNRDPLSAMISALKQEVANLKQEIRTYQKILNSSDNENLKQNFESLKSALQNESSGEDFEENKINKLKLQQMEKKLAQSNSEIEFCKNLVNDLQLEMFQVKKERDIFKANNERYLSIIKTSGIVLNEEEDSSVKLIDEYNEVIGKLRKTNDSKDILIGQLTILKENLEKELEREKKISLKKSAEVEDLRRKRPYDQDPISEVLIKNVDDYGRIFAETIMAKISKQEPVTEIESESHTEESLDESLISTKPEAEELATVEGKIKEKEEILKNIEEAFRDLQSQLIEEMSKQYYKKIEELEIEKKNTERDRDLALDKIKEGSSSDKQAVADKFKAKIQALEEKLKENKRKDKELTTLQKLVETQKSQLGKLDEEIRKAKTERIRLQNNIKEKNEEIHKWKALKQKEILDMKKNTLKKDQQIQMLKSENRKKEILVKKQNETIAAIQRKEKTAAIRKKNPISGVDINDFVLWVQEYTAACIDEREISISMTQEVDEREEIEKDIKEIMLTYSEKMLKLERLELILSENGQGLDQDELYCETRQLKSEISEIIDTIDVLEGKIKRKNELILGYSHALSNSRIEQIKQKAMTVSTLDDSYKLIQVLFDEVLSKSTDIKNLQKIVAIKNAEIENKQELIEKTEKETQMIIKKYENEILKLKTEFKVKEFVILEELNSLKNIESGNEPRKYSAELIPSKKDSETVSKESKTNKSTIENKFEEEKIKTSKSINFMSYSKTRENLKNNKKNDAEEEKKIRKSPISRGGTTKVLDEEGGSILRNLAKTKSLVKGDSQKKLQKWKLMNSIDHSNGVISSLVTQENMLYTATNCTIGIWSLDTLSTISEIIENKNKNIIKAMTISPTINSLITSSGKTIKVFDTVACNIQMTFDIEIEEIKDIKASDNYIVISGKSGENSNSLHIWDIRNNWNPIFQGESSEDINTLEIYNEEVFYPKKNNAIFSYSHTTKAIQNYEPAHSKIVTGIKVFGDSLVSVSRDRSIKQFDIRSKNLLANIENSHTDWINCIEKDPRGRFVCTGSKEGKIKVWKGTEGLKLAGELLGLNSSILCMSFRNAERPSIVSAGNDKTFKIWDMIEEGEI